MPAAKLRASFDRVSVLLDSVEPIEGLLLAQSGHSWTADETATEDLARVPSIATRVQHSSAGHTAWIVDK